MTGKLLTALTLVVGLASYTKAQSDDTGTGPVVPPAAPTTPDTSAPAKLPLQNRGPLSVHALLSVPLGDFGEEENGAATLGFGLGAELTVPLQGSRTTQLVFGAYYIHNPMDVSEFEDATGFSADADGWNNFGILGGIRADFPETDGVYMQGMAGLNMATPGDITFTDGFSELTQTGSTGTSFAFALGLGKRSGPWDFSVRYMNMGEPEIDVKIEDESGNTVAEGEAEQKISMIVFGVGYSF